MKKTVIRIVNFYSDECLLAIAGIDPNNGNKPITRNIKMSVFSGNEPTVGSFTVGQTSTEFCIYIAMKDGQRRERYIPVADNLSHVYAVLRENGFTISGYQSAEVINFRR